MTLNPAHRPTIEQILAHPWMRASIPSTEEIVADFTTRKQLVDQEAHNERESKRQARREAQQTRNVRRSGNDNVEEGEVAENRDAWQNLEVEEYGPYYVQDYTQFFMTSPPLDYFDDLVKHLDSSGTAFSISGSTLRLNYNI